MSDYHATRDQRALPMFELTNQLATLAAPTADMQRLLGAIQGDQRAMDTFVRMNAGVTTPSEFFADDAISRRMAGAAAG